MSDDNNNNNNNKAPEEGAINWAETAQKVGDGVLTVSNIIRDCALTAMAVSGAIILGRAAIGSLSGQTQIFRVGGSTLPRKTTLSDAEETASEDQMLGVEPAHAVGSMLS